MKTKTIDASLVTFTDITQDLRNKLYEQVEGLYENKAASAAMGAITAAVVGVVLNLGVFLGTAVIFPEDGGIDRVAVVVAALAFVGLARFGLAIHWLVLAGAAFGLARMALGA